MAKFCTSCGGALEPGVKFCSQCGTHVEDAKPLPKPGPETAPREIAAASGPQATIPSEPTIARPTTTQANKRLFLWIALAVVAILVIGGSLFYFSRPHTNKDDFSADKALDPGRWQAGTPLLAAVAEAQGSRYVVPQLTFDPLGMRMAGVNGTYEFTGIQSTYAFSPPFSVRVKVMGTISHGNTFGLYILGNDFRQSQSLKIEGNLNPQSGYQGLSIGSVNVLRDVGTDQWYTVVVAVDAKGSGTVTFTDSHGTPLVTKAGLQLGLGPFFVILGQREGAPFAVGPNEAVWSFAEVTSGSNPVASSSNENNASDADIARNIKAAFFNDATLRKETIDVTAQNGIVTLTGVVNADSDKSNAVRIANQQQAVRQVVDQLIVSTSTSSSSGLTEKTPRDESVSPQSGQNIGPPATVVVPGNQPWTATGIFLDSGKRIEISATGNVSMGGGSPPMPPTGRPPNCDGRRGFPAGELPCWSLIGRIGEQGTIFYVGSKISFQVPTSGQLLLGVNDDTLGDNGGSWTATVIVHPPANAVTSEVNPTVSRPQPTYVGTWLGFANETSPQDRETELRQSCKADFRRVYVPLENGNRFTDLCHSVGKTCERVCDWQGNSISCSAISQGGNRDGSRIALCR